MKKQRKAFKKACERYQNLSEEKKTKSAYMLVSDIEIFLKKKKRRSVNMVVNNIKFAEYEKQRLVEYINNYFIM